MPRNIGNIGYVSAALIAIRVKIFNFQLKRARARPSTGERAATPNEQRGRN